MGLDAAALPARSQPAAAARGEVVIERAAPAGALRAELLDWLDDGLRGGRRGRLLAEYGPLLEEPGAAHHVVCRIAGEPVSHVLWRVAEARAGGVALPVGMLGLVYTDPRARGRGLAGRALRAALEEIAARGAVLAALWSEKRDFYARLGFEAAGVERMLRIDASLCAAARAALGSRAGLEVSRARPGDGPALDALYAAKSARLARPSGWLARLAAAPDCELRVARAQGRVVAYAACGRGDDLQGVVHEWAGEPDAVLACASDLLGGRPALLMLAGPELEAPVRALRVVGAEELRGSLALIRVLDPARLPGGLEALSASDPRAGWPLFLWGFDSI